MSWRSHQMLDEFWQADKPDFHISIPSNVFLINICCHNPIVPSHTHRRTSDRNQHKVPYDQTGTVSKSKARDLVPGTRTP